MEFDSYRYAGVLVAVDLANELALAQPAGERIRREEMVATLSRILAIDPPSVAQLTTSHVPGFVALSRELRDVFSDLHERDVDSAASRLNVLLARHSAHPHLAKEKGIWRLHHHPADAALLPMWTAICAEALASMVGRGNADRLGLCTRADCGRAYVDVSKNASRKFCSLTCQNRVKAATFRQRRSAGGMRSPKRRPSAT